MVAGEMSGGDAANRCLFEAALGIAGMLVSAEATVNTAQLRVVFISIRASVLCFTIRAVSFRSAYDRWGDRTIPKVRSSDSIKTYATPLIWVNAPTQWVWF
jgi:hypothetical protein